MNPDSPQSPREQLEARLTAFLLGEASADEAAEMRQAIKDDPQLAELYHRLEETIHLVRETGATTAQPAPRKLSEERRQKLLAQFKTVTPREFARPQKRPHQRTRFDTIIEIAAVITLVGVLVGMLLPSLAKSKAKAVYAQRAPAKLTELFGKPPPAASPPPDHQPKEEQELLSRSDIEAKKSDEQTPVPGLSGKLVPIYATPVLPQPETPKQEIFLPRSNESAEVSKDLAQKEDSLGLSEVTTESGRPARIPSVDLQTTATSGGGGAGGRGGFGGAGGRGSNVGDVASTGPLDQSVVEGPASNRFIGRYAYIANPAGSNLDTDFIHNQAQPPAAAPSGAIDPATGLPVSNNGPTTDFYRNTTFAQSNVQTPRAPVSGTYFGGINGQAGAVYSPGATGTPITIDVNPVPTVAEPNTRLRAGLALGGSRMAAGITAIPSASATPPASPEPGSAPPVNFSDNLVASKDAAASSEQIPITYANAANISTSLESLSKPSDTKAEQPTTLDAGVMVSTNFVAPSQPGQSNDLESDAAWRFPAGQHNIGWLGRVSQFSEGREKLAENITNDGDLNNKKVPVLGDVPGLGYLFRSSNKSDTATFTNGIALPQLAQSEEKLDLRATPQLTASSGTPNVAFNYTLSNQPDSNAVKVDPQTHQVIVADDKNLSQAITGTVRQLAERKFAEKSPPPVSEAQLLAEDRGLPHPATPAAIPQPEVLTSSNAFSTFSLNVSDVSFKLAAASLEKGVMPDPATVRSEEFINAFDYRDPAPPPGAPIGFAWERSQDPFAQNRDLLRFSVQTAAAGREPGRPLNLVLLLDNSGSMERADRVQIIHEALRVLATQLQPSDTLSVVIFARTPRLWVDGVPGSQAGDVAEKVSGLTPQGGTNLEDAMKLAYETALRHYLANGINRVVLLTDGAANLGNVDPTALKQKVETNRKQGIALDCFGIGWEGYNDDLLEVLSRNGDGRYGFLNTPEDVATGFAGQLAGALHVAAADVKVQVEFNPARVNSYRQIGYAKHQLTKQQFRDNSVDAAEIGAAESGNALYTVEVNPQGDGPLATVRVRYKVPATGEYREQAWPVPYTGASAPLDKSSPAMRLSATAGEFSEWLASSPYAADVTPDQLLNYLGGVPEVYGVDGRPKKLEWMLRQAKSLSGK